MLFDNGFLSADGVLDMRVKVVLQGAGEIAGETLHAFDIILAASRFGDAISLDILSQALMPGVSLNDLASRFEAHGPCPVPMPIPRRTRESFSPRALMALDEFDVALSQSGGLLDEVALEVLMCCVLDHVDDRTVYSLLDVQRAKFLFHRRIEQSLRQFPRSHRQSANSDSHASGNSAEGEFILPSQIAPSEDLTLRVQAAAASGTYPFDEDPRFNRVFDGMTRILHRRQGNHVLLTGERGVSKNTVLSELARRAAVGRIPFLKHRRFLRVDCRYVPPDESRARLAAILDAVTVRPELVVCLEGLASLLATGHKETNRAILLSSLSQARCQFVGLLTPREFEEIVADDPDLCEFFSRVEVEEPDLETALRILGHFAQGLERKYEVAIDTDAVRQAVVLSANYILNDQLPAKALRILHRVCEDIDYERHLLGSNRNRVTEADVVRVVEELSGVPSETLRGIAERSDYEQSLGKFVFGQEHAVRAVAAELGLIKAGMSDPNKPASVMLFLGQTGTGKTEMAKSLARFYSTSKRLKTYTLGNCVEPHSVSTIIGVPPGYVGHDQGGRLVNELNSDPYSVFLLDEADKAHPDVLQPFLNLFDEGWVNDQRGVRGYASKSIFILTTNVGQHMIAEMIRQGNSMEEISRRMKEVLSQIRHTKSDRPVFAPEFLARVKRIIVFNSLGRQAMDGICRRLVGEMQSSWSAKRGKQLEIPDMVLQLIAERGHSINEKSNGREGGRIIHKQISEWIEAKIQQEISLRPGEYKECSKVALELSGLQTGSQEDQLPELNIHFRAQ